METRVIITTSITDNEQCKVIAGILARLALHGMDYHAKYEAGSEPLSQEVVGDGTDERATRRGNQHSA